MSLNVARAGAGDPLALIHGIGGDLCVWDPVLDALAARHDVIAIDLPGFGESEPLPDGVEPAPAALASAVAATLDDLGLERVHVAGNSLGAWVALELARAGRAKSVTALCPAGLWGGPLIGPDEEPTQGGAQRAARRVRALIPLVLRVPRVRRAVLANFVAHPDRVPYHDAVRMARSYAAAPAYAATNVAMRRAALGDLSGLTLPITVAFGTRDRLIKPAPDAVPQARVVMLDDCGHIPMFDAPDRVVSLIEETVNRGMKTWASGPTASA